MIRIGIALLALCGLTCTSALAQGTVTLLSFEEELVGSGGSRSLIPAGRTLVGISLCESADGAGMTEVICDDKKALSVNLSNFYLVLPRSKMKSVLCTTLATVDGRYSAEGRHELTSDVEGRTKLEFTTDFTEELSDYNGSQFLVLVRQAEACDRTIKPVYVPSYSGQNPDTLRVALDLGRSDAKVWIEENGQPKTPPSTCKRKVQAMKTHYCFLPMSWKTGGKFDLVVEITERGRSQKPKPFQVALP